MDDGFEDMVLRCMSEDDRELDDFLSSLLSEPLPAVPEPAQVPLHDPAPPVPVLAPPAPNPVANPFAQLITTPVMLSNDQQQTLLAIQALLGACQNGAWPFMQLQNPANLLAAEKKPKSDKPKPIRIRNRKRQSDTIKALQKQIEELRVKLQELMAQKDHLNDRELLLNKLVSKRDEQWDVLEKALYAVPNSSEIPGTSADSDGIPASPSDDSTGTAESVAVAATATAPLCSADQFVLEWKQVLRGISQHLLNLEVNQGGEVNNGPEELRELCRESQRRTDEMALLNRPAIRRIMTLNLEDMKPAQPKPEHWVKIVQMLNLTHEQKTAVRIACEDWTCKMRELGETRDAIYQRVRELTPEPSAVPAAMLDEQHYLAEALAEELAENAMKVWQVCVVFFTTFTSKILEPLQYARAAVYSYPFFIDAFSMIRIIVADEEARATPPAAAQAAASPPHAASPSHCGSQHSEVLSPALSMAASAPLISPALIDLTSLARATSTSMS